MARKRSRKKIEKRLGAVVDRLEELARRGADEEFLALAAAELPDPAHGPLAGRWAEIAGRALRRALAAADPGRLGELLRRLGPAGRTLPLAPLASAVIDLAAGRAEAARVRLAELDADGRPDAAAPGGLLPVLRTLAGEDPGTAAGGVPELADLARLRASAAPPKPAGGEPAARGRTRPRDPYLRAVADLLLALRDLEAADCRPAEEILRTLRRRLRALTRAAPGGDPALGRLLETAARYLDLLGDLADLGTRLGRPPEGQPASRMILDRLRRPAGALAAALIEPAPPPLAPLAHALRLRWREVLAALAEREGAEGLATLAASRPELVNPEVGLPAGDRGAGGDLARARRARALLAGERFEELAGLLRARARGENGGGELAALWSLELWSLRNADRVLEEDDDLDLADPFDDDGGEPAEPLPHRAMVRIEEMASQIGRRFAAEQRAEVARELRRELFLVCEAIALCDHTSAAAATLLDHLPSDAGLLIVGIAGAVASGDRRCRRDLEARLARRGTLKPDEAATARRMMAQVAMEPPEYLVPALEALRPLFAEPEWQQTCELVAHKVAPMIGGFLAEASDLSWLAPGAVADAAELVRPDLERLRPTLGATSGYAALELALDCWRPRPAGVVKKVRALLAAHPGYETALAATRVLGSSLVATGPFAAPPEGAQAALEPLTAAVVDRLDDRWRQWWFDVPILALGGTPATLRKLERHVDGLLAGSGLDEPGRHALERSREILDQIDSALGAPRRGRDRAARRPRRPPRRRRPAGAPAAPVHGRRKPKTEDRGQLQLDLDLG